MMTVQAPHCPSPQPNFGPWRSRSLRSTYKSGVDGWTSTVWLAPLTFSVMLLIGDFLGAILQIAYILSAVELEGYDRFHCARVGILLRSFRSGLHRERRYTH
jgi:hypothetical protein